MDPFRAYRVFEKQGKVTAHLDRVTLDDLSEGDIVLRTVWSDINYKDALTATGKGKIMCRFPMVAGIDVAGYVASSTDSLVQQLTASRLTESVK